MGSTRRLFAFFKSHFETVVFNLNNTPLRFIS